MRACVCRRRCHHRHRRHRSRRRIAQFDEKKLSWRVFCQQNEGVAANECPRVFCVLTDPKLHSFLCVYLFCLQANPGGSISDLRALADICDDVSLPLIVDNTLATPALCRPFEHGASLVRTVLPLWLVGARVSLGVRRRVSE